jgi:hypothetical protein
MRCISIVRSLYFKIFSASFLITFLSPEIATSISMHVIIIISSSSSSSSSSSGNVGGGGGGSSSSSSKATLPVNALNLPKS